MTKIQMLSAQDLKKRYDANPELFIIDVREPHEWETLRIPYAISIPLAELKGKINSIMPDYNHPIYLHCKSGVRSCTAANQLIEAGYTEVYSLNGGIMEWAKLGFPIEVAK